MATITSWSTSGGHGGGNSKRRIVSGVAAVADTVQLSGLDLGYSHVFIGIQLLDSDGAALDAATAGSFALKAKTWNTQRWIALDDGATLDATALDDASAAGDIDAIQVVPSSVSGNDATSYRVYITAFRD